MCMTVCVPLPAGSACRGQITAADKLPDAFKALVPGCATLPESQGACYTVFMDIPLP